MKILFTIMGNISRLVSGLVFLCGIVILCLAGKDFIEAIKLVFEETNNKSAMIAAGMLKTVDFVLISLVFFIFSLGIAILFTKESEEKKAMILTLPEWLQIKNLTQLKVILWETILTTFIVTYIADLALHKVLKHGSFTTSQLILPGAVFLLSLSLYFLKKGEN
ncbi:YqhA family protein [Flavobacterium sp.]|uniref:YqhA family protein n=1 Tax=Flavobacterium sp. TaxID=239 RepID=UPI003A91030E